MNIVVTLKVIKISGKPAIFLYINFDGISLSIGFSKYHNEYISVTHLAFDDSIAEYLLENKYVIIDDIIFGRYKNASEYTFRLTSTALLQLL